MGSSPPFEVEEGVETLRRNRSVLLACEAIGWFHMVGKARVEFLHSHGGLESGYDYKRWHEKEEFDWDELLGWVKERGEEGFKSFWPDSIAKLIEKHTGKGGSKFLVLLQAAHGIVSGTEKNLPDTTSWYLSQLLPHIWLSSPFGHPKRNLTAEPPEVLSMHGWKCLVTKMKEILEKLKGLGEGNVQDLSEWVSWRQQATGPHSFIRKAFLSTVAETRLPNNDITLWDQSYVTAALFKSATAGLLLNKEQQVEKEKTRWRLLTVGIGTDHYEMRAVKIGDWTGMRKVLEEFFRMVSQLVEVDLAVGSLLYQDSSVAVFSFPGEKYGSPHDQRLEKLSKWLEEEVYKIAADLKLETPPVVRLSEPTRSLIRMIKEIREVKQTLSLPIHTEWKIPCVHPEGHARSKNHTCPVCQVRPNGTASTKNKPCEVCQNRRLHRLDDWLQSSLGHQTIWFEEVADQNDRIALLTLSLDLEPWLEGEHIDSLRSQAIAEWRRLNPLLSPKSKKSNPIDNPIDPSKPLESLQGYISRAVEGQYDKNDPVLSNLHAGFQYESDWQTFFEKVVEDRADSPTWQQLEDKERAAWFAHQFFRKLPSAGRVYRFWREAQEFFELLLEEFRQISARSANHWRIKRLLIKPKESTAGKHPWRNRSVYNGQWRNAPLSLLYLGEGYFLTISNLARILKPEESPDVLKEQEILLHEEDAFGNQSTLKVDSAETPGNGRTNLNLGHLGIYYPLIPLELSPLRFRVIVPLEAASDCIDFALERWNEAFARVKDRLPLHVGIVAFKRTLPFQAVIEATRNVEAILTSQSQEWWYVEAVEHRRSEVVLSLRRRDGQISTQLVPWTLPDGRKDVFYPYITVEKKSADPGYPLDFQRPKGQHPNNFYRHVTDLRRGEKVSWHPARVIALFMEDTSSRFEHLRPLYAEDWDAIRKTWLLLTKVAPSQTALRKLESALSRLQADWKEPLKLPFNHPSGNLWHDTVRALIATHLEIKKGDVLESLTQAAVSGILQKAIEWHMTVLKASIPKGG